MRELDEQPAAGTTPPPRIAKVTHNLLRQYMGYAYEYDVQGNTIVKRPRIATVANEEGVLTFSYDSDNRMTMAVRTFATSRIVARYSYDAFGRRIAKRVDEQRWAAGDEPPAIGQAHTGKLTLFVWDGDVMVQEILDDKTVTYLYEPDSFVPLARVRSAEGVILYGPTAFHAPPTIAAWEPALFREQLTQYVKPCQKKVNDGLEIGHYRCWQSKVAGAENLEVHDTVQFYECDHLGTPLQLISEQGEAIWSAKHSAWGTTFCSTKVQFEQLLRFQGQYADEETGFYYNRYRYYDPQAARYLTQDPIRLQGGTNLYRYAPNPVRWADPLGLTCKAYRVIRPDEDPEKGIFPKDPSATYTPEGHVLHGSRPRFASQYISATKSLGVAQGWAKLTGNRIVEIDLSRVNGTVIDVSGDCSALKGVTAKNWARKSQEVLILGHVPPSALRIL